MSDTSNIPDPGVYDTPIERATIDTLPIEVFDKWLDTVRERRLALVRKIEAAKAVRDASNRREAIDKFNKELARVYALQDKVDQQIATFEVRVNKLRVIAVEME